MSNANKKLLDRMLLNLLSPSGEADPRDERQALAVADSKHLDQLIGQACHHNAGVMLANELAHRTELPLAFLQKIRYIHRRALLRDLKLAVDTARVTRAFDQGSRMRIRFYKGPVTWRALKLPAPSKLSSDIDMLVPSQDIERADSVLNAIGYSRISISPNEATYRSPLLSSIDLHWSLLTVGEWGDRLQPILDMVWQNSQTVEIEGTQVFTLCPNTSLMALTLHASCHHLCDDWASVYDISMCTLAWQSLIDWQHILALARELSLSSAFYSALRLAAEHFGAAVPAGVLRDLKPSRCYEIGLQLLYRAAFEGKLHSHRHHSLARVAHHLLQPGLGRKATLVKKRLAVLLKRSTAPVPGTTRFTR